MTDPIDLKKIEHAIVTGFASVVGKKAVKDEAPRYSVRLNPLLHDLAIRGWHDVDGPVVLGGFRITRGSPAMTMMYQFVLLELLETEAR